MDFFVIVPEKRKTGRCCVRLCRHKTRKKSHDGNFCRRCRDRRYAIANPVSYAWDKLRYSAKRRNIQFSLTLDEFRKFCAETSYIEKKGKEKGSLTVDRIDASKGYSYSNIQVLTQEDNGRKSHVDKKLAKYHEPEKPNDDEPPF